MINKKITVSIPKFDEARPVAEIVQTASRFASTMYFISGNKKINAKSIMGMMSLGLCNDEEIEVEADGDDENEAVEAIVNYMTNSF
ncbi:catabolite repression HPr-like protein [Lachnospiraceae bacterium]|jgi:catabolite repression HPr-like protein|nr:catabolite repression HPr-like protein [Lachnospiraceae bacterium]